MDNQRTLWNSAFYVELPVPLQSKSNYRHNSGKNWKALSSFEMVTAHTLRQELPDEWDVGERTAKLADRPKVLLVIVAQSRHDVTNYSKSIADAAEGTVVINDASITATTSIGVHSGKDQRAVVAFAQMSKDATLAEQASALNDLTNYAVEQFS